MFKNLLDLEYKRTWLQAIGFYLAYFLFIVILGFLAGALIGLAFSGSNLFGIGVQIGNIMAIIICLALSFTILYKKNQLKSFGLILLALLSGILAFFGGGLLGLIPAAFLTTR